MFVLMAKKVEQKNCSENVGEIDFRKDRFGNSNRKI